MNKLILLALISFNANATERFNPLQGVNNNQVIQSQAQSQNNSVSVQGASVGGISNDNGDVISNIHTSNKRNPVNSAIAPTSDVNVICPVITVGGHSAQFVFAGVATTGKANVNALCMAYHLKQFDVVEAMLCNTDSDYKKANVNCAK